VRAAFQVFGSVEALLESGAADVLVVSTPNMTHAGVLLAVLAHPRPHHVLVEKPLCTSIADCKKVGHRSLWQDNTGLVKLPLSWQNSTGLVGKQYLIKGKTVLGSWQSSTGFSCPLFLQVVSAAGARAGEMLVQVGLEYRYSTGQYSSLSLVSRSPSLSVLRRWWRRARARGRCWCRWGWRPGTCPRGAPHPRGAPRRRRWESAHGGHPASTASPSSSR